MLIYILISFVNEINKRRASIFVPVKCNSGNKGKNEISQQQVRMGTKSRPVIIVDYKHAAWLARCGARGPQFATLGRNLIITIASAHIALDCHPT